MRIGILHEGDAHRRHVIGCRDQVVGELVVGHGALLPLALLHERPTDALDHAALDLTAGEGRVQHLANLLDGHEVDHARTARAEIDLHLGDVRGPGEGTVRVASIRLVVPLDARRPFIGRLADGGFTGMLSMPPPDGILHRLPPARVVEPDAAAQVVARPLDQAADDHRGARRHRGAAVRDPRRVRLGDDHVVGLESQSIRRELGEHRECALTHLDVRAQHLHAAVRAAGHAQPRLERRLAAARESGPVIERRETHAPPHGGVGRVEAGVLVPLLPIAGELEGPLHHRHAVRPVPDHLTRGGRLTVLEQVDAPQLDGIHAERARDHVHVALARELGLRRAKPAERTERHGVREHRAPRDTHVVAGVRTGGVDDGA